MLSEQRLLALPTSAYLSCSSAFGSWLFLQLKGGLSSLCKRSRCSKRYNEAWKGYLSRILWKGSRNWSPREKYSCRLEGNWFMAKEYTQTATISLVSGTATLNTTTNSYHRYYITKMRRRSN